MLNVTGGLESPHLPFLLARRLMGVLGPLVPVTIRLMHRAHSQLPVRRTLTHELVGDHDPRRIPMPLQQLAKKPFGRLRISPRLHQNIQHITILIYRPPQVVLIPVDSDEHLIKMPGIPATPCLSPDPLGIFRPESKAPLPNRFVGDLDAPAPQDLFDVSEAQRKPVVKPNSSSTVLKK